MPLTKAQILSIMADIDAEAGPSKVARTSLPKVYYDGLKFHIPTTSGSWVSVDRSGAHSFLAKEGFSSEKEKGEPLSEIGETMVRIQTEHDVNYVGALAGYPAGLRTMNNAKILVTSSPTFISPLAGDWSMLRGLLENLLGQKQLPYFYGWLQVALDMYRTSAWHAGQVLVLCGPAGAGKNLLRELITEMLGGRVAHPHHFMTGRTSFSSDLFAAETLAIEDQQDSSNISARKNLAAAIKDFAVNREHRCERKHCDPLTLVPLWRLIISMNDEPERIQVLPPLDDDVADKIMLFKVAKHDMPRSTKTAAEQAVFWKELVDQLPMFIHFLDQWAIPQELECQRYGVKHYHDLKLRLELDATSPEHHLREMIYTVIFPDDTRAEWEGTASDLEAKLTAEDSPCRGKARNILRYPSNCGTYLGRMEKKGSRVARRLVNGTTVWTLTNFQHILSEEAKSFRRQAGVEKRRAGRIR